MAPLLLLLLIVAAAAPQVCGEQPTDAQLLLWFMSNLTNGAEKLPSWQPGTDPCGSWAGVECGDDSRVTEL